MTTCHTRTNSQYIIITSMADLPCTDIPGQQTVLTSQVCFVNSLIWNCRRIDRLWTYICGQSYRSLYNRLRGQHSIYLSTAYDPCPTFPPNTGQGSSLDDGHKSGLASTAKRNQCTPACLSQKKTHDRVFFDSFFSVRFVAKRYKLRQKCLKGQNNLSARLT